MAKKVSSVALHKKRPIKTVEKSKKLKTLLKNISKYMIRDVYMFSLLTSPKFSRRLLSASSGEESTIRKKKGNNCLQEVEEYLKCDCHMYAPFCYDSPSVKDKSEHIDRMEHGTEKIQTTEEPGEITPTPTKTIAVKHVLVEKETVKRIVLQNGGSSYASGDDVLHKELDKAA